MNPSAIFFFCSVTFCSLASPLWGQLEDWDTDQDGMPTAWEYHRELDLDDPRDAWADPDQDGVCNLFEYYLGTHPQDPFQPVFIPYDGSRPLEFFIKNAPRGSVLQVPAGVYDLNYLYAVQDPVPRLMIQGGWNAAFTERDPCRYTTTFNGRQEGPILDYFITADNSAALILDGLSLKNGSAGAVKFISYRSKVQLALSNCQIMGNETDRFDAIVRFEDGPFTIISDCIVINTLLAGNQGTALQVQQYANHTNLKVLNSLITDNHWSANDLGAKVSAYGLHFVPRVDSSLHLQIVNTVLWGNDNADVFYDNPQLHPLDAESRHNIYGTLKSLPDSLIWHGSADRFTDPQLLITKEDYRFAPRSPALGTGTDIGYHATTAPDLGPDFCASTLTNTQSIMPAALLSQVYPNPVKDLLQLELAPTSTTVVELRLLNSLGQVIRQERWFTPVSTRHSIQMGHLPAGLYQLWLTSGDQVQGYTILRR